MKLIEKILDCFRNSVERLNAKTISIRVSVLKNYCPIFYGISRIWVEFKDMLKNFEVDFILKSYKKC